MSPVRPRLPAFARAAGVVLALSVAFITAPIPWPNPVEGTHVEPNDDGEFARDWGLSEDPLFTDLERGRWKVGDSVGSVEARYKYIKTFVMVGFTHGEFTTYRTTVPLWADCEVVAVRGRLRAAGVAWSPIPRHSRFDRVYFDTLTREEWAAHDASYERALAAFHAKLHNGIKQP